MGPGGAVVGRDRDGRQAEHRVRQHGAGDASGHLGGDVAEEVAAGQAAERGVDDRHHRVEVGARDRPEDEDEGEEAGRRRGRVLEQLQPGVVGGELGGGDARADHRGGEEGGAHEPGQEASAERRAVHRREPKH
jgi:hypothetical protein